MEALTVFLFVALAVLAGLAWWKGRQGTEGGARRILSIRCGLMLGPRTKLLIIEGFGPARLIAVSHGSVTLLASQEEQAEQPLRAGATPFEETHGHH